MIKLGDEVRDVVTGLQGIAIGRTEWLYGCAGIGVQPPINKDGKKDDATWLDETRLEVVTPQKVKAPKIVLVESEAGEPVRSGGPQPSVKSQNEYPA